MGGEGRKEKEKRGRNKKEKGEGGVKGIGIRYVKRHTPLRM